jgi:hypothetical protein
MSEPIGMNIKIGGDLHEEDLEEFLTILNNEIVEIIGPTTEEELRKTIAGMSPICPSIMPHFIQWWGMSAWRGR